MSRARSRLTLLGVLSVTVCLVVGLSAGAGAAAKKKKSGSKAANVTGTVGAVPNGPTSFSGFGFATTNPVPFKGTATVGKKFKGKTVGDVDATVSMTGVSAAGTTCGGICQVIVRLTAPNGATSGLLFGFPGAGGVSGNLVSNLTLSDQTPTRTCADNGTATPPPPCGDPNATLLAPFTGTARPGAADLYLLNGSRVSGTWTLTAFDLCGAAACFDQGTASIAAWSLRITPARAPR